jgi:hypothetical protein
MLHVFWFGLEILRLVYKKSVFWNFERFLSYLTFYLPKKVVPPLIRVEIFFSPKLAGWGIKRSGILRWFQKCAGVLSLAKGKKMLQKNWTFRDLENFAKNRFPEKKFLGTSWRKSSTHFWNQRKIPLLLIPFAPNFEEFFFNSYKGQCCFLG